AGIMAVLAFFTKAAAAFYIVALGVAAVIPLLSPDQPSPRLRRSAEALRGKAEGGSHEHEIHGDTGRRAALWTLAGLAIALGIIAAVFVLPNWNEYRFYNWQISVTRKPAYDLKSIIDRVSWFPVLHDTFSRMWFEV